jgi:hypothetical protein
MIIQADRDKVFRRIHDQHIMGETINLGVDFSTGSARTDLAEYYEQITNPEKQIVIETYVTEQEMETIKTIFPQWIPDEQVWAKDGTQPADIRQYGEQLYRCIQSHVTQTDWQPDLTPALWGIIAAPEEYIEWYPDIYLVIQVGEKVQWNSVIYECVNPTYAWIEPGTQDGHFGWAVV